MLVCLTLLVRSSAALLVGKVCAPCLSGYTWLGWDGKEGADTAQRTWDPVSYVLSAGAATATTQQPRTSGFIMYSTAGEVS